MRGKKKKKEIKHSSSVVIIVKEFCLCLTSSKPLWNFLSFLVGCVCVCVRTHLISLCCLPVEEEGLVSVNRAFTILLLSYCTLPVRTIYDLD